MEDAFEFLQRRGLVPEMIDACAKLLLSIHDEGLGYEEVGSIPTIRIRITQAARLHAVRIGEGTLRVVAVGGHNLPWRA